MSTKTTMECFDTFFPNLKSFIEDAEVDGDVFKPEILKQKPQAFFEYSLLMGFDKTQLTDEEFNSHEHFKYRLFYNRIICHSDESALNDPSVFISDEYLLAKAIKDIPLESLSSIKQLQLKYLTATTKESRNKAYDKYKELYPDAESIELRAYLKLTLAHRFGKLEEFEKNIKVTKDCRFLGAWKRCREYIKAVKDKPAISLDSFIEQLPSMNVVKEPVFNYDEKDPIFNFNMLLSALPYASNDDKADIVNKTNDYMNNKTIVKMLPQYKDCWNNGRLVFEIGDDDKDFFKNYKGVLNTKYFVITVNPVDLLFCSTDQEYQSCYSLLSDYGSTPGLPNFIAQPHTAMCFLSSGSMSKPWRHDRFPGLAFKHIKIKARAFLFTSEDEKHIGVGRTYAPNEIQRAGKGGIGTDWDFRNQAQLFMFKLLKEAKKEEGEESNTMEYLLSSGMTKKYIFNMKENPECLSRIFDTKGKYVFTTPSWKFRSIESGCHTEVYLDNLKLADSETSKDEFRYEIGSGSCSRFVCNTTLSSRYRVGLERVQREQERAKRA